MARILCVEDEDFIREDIVEELEEAGHEVLQADSGADGLRTILSNTLDLVLCDITMPVMDGHALLTELRRNHPAYDDLPFVFLSALGDRKDVIAGKRLGADDYLTKPIDFEMLHATVETRLRQVDRMTERKEEQMVRLYKALSGSVGNVPDLADATPADEEPVEENPDALRLTIMGDAGETASIAEGLRRVGHRVTVLSEPDDRPIAADGSSPDILLITATASLRHPDVEGLIADLDCPKILLMPKPSADIDSSTNIPGFDAVINWQGDTRLLDAELGTVAASHFAAKRFLAI